MNLIVYSGNEAFREGAQKIKEDTIQHNKECEVIEIEDFRNVISRIQTDCVYFLSSDKKIPEFCEILKEKDCKIINDNFFLNNIETSKYDSLKKCNLLGICVPNNFELNQYDPVNFLDVPMFIKTKNPRGLVKKCLNKNLIGDEIEKIQIKDRNCYYLEEDVFNQDCSELKIYYVNGKIFFMDDFSENTNIDWLHQIMNKISKQTNLEVFSVDFILNFKTQKYYCIDINHASSFFKSNTARNEFITKILQ